MQQRMRRTGELRTYAPWYLLSTARLYFLKSIESPKIAGPAGGQGVNTQQSPIPYLRVLMGLPLANPSHNNKAGAPNICSNKSSI